MLSVLQERLRDLIRSKQSWKASWRKDHVKQNLNIEEARDGGDEKGEDIPGRCSVLLGGEEVFKS